METQKEFKGERIFDLHLPFDKTPQMSVLLSVLAERLSIQLFAALDDDIMSRLDLQLVAFPPCGI